MLAEDNLVNIKLAQRVLQKMNYQVSVAQNGKQVLTMLRDAIPENKNAAKFLPIIALTAHAVSDIRDKALNAGMNGYLTKPIDIAQFHKNIVNILEESSLEKNF